MKKYSFRQKIWDYLRNNQLVDFPLSVYNRIPNFKGAAEAAERLAELDEFKKASVIRISPYKPQEPVRFLALESNKEILVPILRFRSGLFFHITPVAGATKDELRTLAKIYSLQKTGKPVGLDSDIKIDLIVIGSVCVSRDGYRLGKGKGLADLEFAMMMRMGAVTQDTTVITTVHDCQIIDSLPPELFTEYDVPVDIIVTPTQTIVVNPKLKKPTGIIWHMLSENKVKTMQVLQQLKEMDEKEGMVITLKNLDSDVRMRRFHKMYSKHSKRKRRYESRKNASNTEDSVAEGEKDKEKKPRFFKQRPYRKSKSEGDSNALTEAEEKRESSIKNVRRGHKRVRHKSKSQIDFSLKLSNISSGVRVRDLKHALQERGVKPSEIYWFGFRGICYLHFKKLRSENNPPEQPIQVDSIMANLQALRIGTSDNEENDFIIVKPAEPISRIEVTDVTSV